MATMAEPNVMSAPQQPLPVEAAPRPMPMPPSAPMQAPPPPPQAINGGAENEVLYQTGNRPGPGVPNVIQVNEADAGMRAGDAQNEGVENDEEAIVKTEFVWADGAERDVKLAGSWSGWMPIQMYHEGGGMWSVVCPVPTGMHEFKFLVDGEWRHSTRHPTAGENEENMNNIRVIRGPPQSHAQQQNKKKKKKGCCTIS